MDIINNNLPLRLKDNEYITVATLADAYALSDADRLFGMTVVVTDDPTPANNGIYILANSNLGGVNNDKMDNSNWTVNNGGSSAQGEAVGTYKAFAMTAIPSNYLWCNGALISIVTYPDLFAIIGTAYGGDGITTFGLPDLQGRFIKGDDGSDIGTSDGSNILSIGQLPSHNHALFANSDGANTDSVAGNYLSSAEAGNGGGLFSDTATNLEQANASSIGLSGSGLPHEHPHIVARWAICFESVGVNMASPTPSFNATLGVDNDSPIRALFNGTPYLTEADLDVVFLTETSTFADIQANKRHIYIGNAPLTIDLDSAIPYPLPVPTTQNFSIVNQSFYQFQIISGGGNSSLTLSPLYCTVESVVFDDFGNGYWDIGYGSYISSPTLQQVLSQGQVATNINAVFRDNVIPNYETRFYHDGFFAQDILNGNENWFNSRFIRKTSTGTKSFFINLPDLTANANLSSFSVNFRPNVTGTVAYLSDIPIYLNETSTIADFQTGRTHYYIGETTITYDYDTLPYPLPVPAQNFNFVNLSVYDVIFTSDSGNYNYTLKPLQALKDITIIDGGVWQLLATEYIDNIYNLQQVTIKGSDTQNAIRVVNNPNTYRTRYSIVGQQIQRDDLGFELKYSDVGIELTRSSGSKSWTLQIPDISGNTNSSSFIVDFRPNVSGTVAYLSDIISGTIAEQTHISGSTVTINNSTTILYVNPAVLLASLTITMPSAPVNGQEVKVSFGGTITGGAVVTTLSILGNTGHTILGGGSIINANAGDGYIFKFQENINIWRIF
jgi:microcystin-dependent protein